jgi:hypothetical protein
MQVIKASIVGISLVVRPVNQIKLTYSNQRSLIAGKSGFRSSGSIKSKILDIGTLVTMADDYHCRASDSGVIERIENRCVFYVRWRSDNSVPAQGYNDDELILSNALVDC